MRHLLFQFPKSRFTGNSTFRQWLNLLSEVLEVGKALALKDYQHAAVETFDVKQSCETMHRILEQQGVDLHAAKKTVLDKNGVRGYYPVDSGI